MTRTADTGHMTSPAVVFLDIDGVVSPLGQADPPDGPVRSVRLFPGLMRFSEPVLARLIQWHRRADVKIEWLTTWEEQAATELAPALGLPSWPTHARRDAPRWNDYTDPQWWKERIVLARLYSGQRVCWIDDDIDDRTDLHGLQRQFGVHLHAVSTDSGVGLTLAQMDAVEVWVSGRSELRPTA